MFVSFWSVPSVHPSGAVQQNARQGSSPPPSHQPSTRARSDIRHPPIPLRSGVAHHRLVDLSLCRWCHRRLESHEHHTPPFLCQERRETRSPARFQHPGQRRLRKEAGPTQEWCIYRARMRILRRLRRRRRMRFLRHLARMPPCGYTYGWMDGRGVGQFRFVLLKHDSHPHPPKTQIRRQSEKHVRGCPS